MPATAALFLIVMFVSFFACIFGIYYLTTRKNLAMIEKGMNPKEFANRPAPYKNLKWALLLIGSGVGLFLAYMLDVYVLQRTFTEVYNGIHIIIVKKTLLFILLLLQLAAVLVYSVLIAWRKNGGTTTKQ